MITQKNFMLMKPNKPPGAAEEMIGTSLSESLIDWTFDSCIHGSILRIRHQGKDIKIESPTHIKDIPTAITWVTHELRNYTTL
jgi:hypothetical protein